MLELDLLRVFVTVAERGGFTRAAKALHRTQSAVSMQIKRLEAAVGTALVLRTARGARLTAEGQVLIVYARHLLALGEEAMGAVAAQASAGAVRMGAIDDYAMRVLPGVLAEFWRVNPGVLVEVRTGLTGDLMERLGPDYDLVLGMQPVGAGRGMVIRRDRPMWTSAAGHRAHEQQPLPLALFPEGCLVRGWAIRALEEQGRAWRCAYVSPSLGALEAAVRAGLGVSLFRRSTRAPGLRWLSPAQGFPQLPEIEIVLHLAQNVPRPAVRLAEHLMTRLRTDGHGG